MKIKGILLATFSLLGMSGALAQVEYDDMYFGKEDRAKLEAQRAAAVAYNAPETRKYQFDEEMSDVNPTDSYSARNVNPEYTSRAHTQTAQSDEADYFVSNYQYNRNQLNNWNNSFNNWYSNPWYTTTYYGPGISSWYTPYYGYSRWNSPWYDPYWSYYGWSSSFSFHYGSRWNYGWGGNYDYWNRPYYAWDPYYGGGLGYFGGGYWNNYRYPGTVVVVTDDYAGRNRTYSKRPSRSTAIASDRNTARSRSSYTNSYSRPSTSGRTTTARQADYYNRYNRANQGNTYNRSTYDNSESTQFNRSRSWSGSEDRSYTPSSGRSTSSPSYSTPSRSTYSGGTGSGTNGRSRGRN